MAEEDAPPEGGIETALPGDGELIDVEVPREPPLPLDAQNEEPLIEQSEHKMFGIPLMGFVKGATTTAAHDRRIAEQEADAERRRDEAAAEKRLAHEHGIHQGNPTDVASLYSTQFTSHPEVMKAYVPLEYMSRHGKDVDYEGVGDIVMAQDPAFDNELTLIIFCPKCKERLPADRSIIHLRQSNRSWHLDTKKAGEMFVFEGQPMRKAGVVMDGEPFTCARCAWRARIDNNRVWTL